MFFIYFLLILSALSYSMAFIFVYKLWYLIFIFLVPIAYLVLSNNFTHTVANNAFKYGFIWGLVAFLIQPYGLYYSLINITEDHKLFIIFMIFLLIIYQALCSSFWIYLISKTTHKIANNNIVKLLIFSIITWLYFYFLENYILWPFSITKAEGLFLLSPILPLTVKPVIFYLLNFIDKSVFLFILILSSGLLSLIFIYKNILAKISLFILSISPFVLSILLNKSTLNNNYKFPKYFNNIAAISKAFYNPGNNTKTALEIAQEIKKIKDIHKDIKIILFPESAFFLCDLKQEKELVKYFDKDIHIIIGAIRKKNNSWYNALYHIYNGQVINKFYKRHSLLLTERPPFNDFDFLNKIILNSYFKSRPIITQSKKERCFFNIDNILKLIPYICSEIFFNNNPDDDFGKDTIIISLCNDSWIPEQADYLQKLMVLANKFKAIYWQRYIIYVDYKSAYIFDKFGNQKYMGTKYSCKSLNLI